MPSIHSNISPQFGRTAASAPPPQYKQQAYADISGGHRDTVSFGASKAKAAVPKFGGPACGTCCTAPGALMFLAPTP